MIQFDEHIFQRGWFNHQLDDLKMYFLLKMGEFPSVMSTKNHPPKPSEMNITFQGEFRFPEEPMHGRIYPGQ